MVFEAEHDPLLALAAEADVYKAPDHLGITVMPEQIFVRYLELYDQIHYHGQGLATLGWNGDPWGIQDTKAGIFINGNLPEMFEACAPQMPYKVAMLSGILHKDWRGPIQDQLNARRIFSGYMPRVTDTLFADFAAEYISLMALIVWSSDVVVHKADDAGPYAKFEAIFARRVGVPVVEITRDTSPVQIAQMIEDTPRQVFPRGDTTLLTTDPRLCQTMHTIYEASFPQPPYFLKYKLATVARRAGRMPWMEIDPAQIKVMKLRDMYAQRASSHAERA